MAEALNAEQLDAVQEEVKKILSQPEFWSGHRAKVIEIVSDNDREWIWSTVKAWSPWLLGGGLLAFGAVVLNVVWGWVHVKTSDELLTQAKTEIVTKTDDQVKDYIAGLKARADSDQERYRLTLTSLAERMTNILSVGESRLNNEEGRFRVRMDEYINRADAEVNDFKLARTSIEETVGALTEFLREKTSEIKQIDRIYNDSMVINALASHKAEVTKELAEYIRTAPEFRHTLWRHAVPIDIIIGINSTEECPSLFQEVGVVDPRWSEEISALRKMVEQGGTTKANVNEQTPKNLGEVLYGKVSVKLCQKKKL